jgi:chromosome segregation ATPase
MPEWTVAIIIALIGAASGAISGLALWHQAKTQRIKTVSESAEAAKVSTAKEWEALTANQRATLEEYRCRLVAVTDRVRELEHELTEARKTIQTLEDRSQEQALRMQEQASKIHLLEQERELWEVERAGLRARIAELEGCK